MPPTKKYEGALSCNVPRKIKQGILKVCMMEDASQSDVARELLEIGLQAKGVMV
jgi:hypothetical protein